MRGARSQPGESTTTNNVRTAVWDTKHRKSSQRRRQPASTQLSERQGTQTPSLAPRAPPSRLKPERELIKVVVFLRERKLGAGQPRAFSSEAARAKAETIAMARSLSYLSSWARSQTVAAFECSLIGPGKTPSFTERPDFTVASIAPAILSRNALISTSLLPDTASSFAIITCAMDRLL